MDPYTDAWLWSCMAIRGFTVFLRWWWGLNHPLMYLQQHKVQLVKMLHIHHWACIRMFKIICWCRNTSYFPNVHTQSQLFLSLALHEFYWCPNTSLNYIYRASASSRIRYARTSAEWGPPEYSILEALLCLPYLSSVICKHCPAGHGSNRKFDKLQKGFLLMVQENIDFKMS